LHKNALSRKVAKAMKSFFIIAIFAKMAAILTNKLQEFKA